MDEELSESYYGLLFGVRRSARYHARRRAFFERLHGAVIFLAVISGSATFTAFATDLGKEWPDWLRFFPSVALTVLAAGDMVFGWARKAWLHADLARKFIDLEREMETTLDPDPDRVAAWTGRRLQVEGDEPPVKQVLNILCHNELSRAMGRPKEKQYDVKFVQRLFAQVVDLREDTIKPYPPADSAA